MRNATPLTTHVVAIAASSEHARIDHRRNVVVGATVIDTVSSFGGCRDIGLSMIR
ncbi:hypothetical protein GS4_02_00340 [Gordonia soli NBRC 108243]|uniref:Uncharacterized protein n=1 Tax=Gordonia soli NBRC 108243 TaxID=1223545 RepID=M0QD14_9ACTN|nr:hypothetical protein GS4_02_00340 [Gordonia soli NBRC 108243]